MIKTISDSKFQIRFYSASGQDPLLFSPNQTSLVTVIWSPKSTRHYLILNKNIILICVRSYLFTLLCFSIGTLCRSSYCGKALTKRYVRCVKHLASVSKTPLVRDSRKVIGDPVHFMIMTCCRRNVCLMWPRNI